MPKKRKGRIAAALGWCLVSGKDLRLSLESKRLVRRATPVAEECRRSSAVRTWILHNNVSRQAAAELLDQANCREGTSIVWIRCEELDLLRRNITDQHGGALLDVITHDVQGEGSIRLTIQR